MKCGDLYLADFPFTDHSTTKLRPIVIASVDRFNHHSDLIALPISSVVHPHDAFAIHISDVHPQFTRTRLKRASAIKWTKPMTISKTVLRRRLGVLWDELRREMLDKLRGLFVE